MTRSGDRHRVKGRYVRIPDNVWEPFVRKVDDEGQTITTVLIRLIRRYLDEG